MITILSFPRSGNHFVRYIVEFLTKRATLGTVGFTAQPNQDTPICLRKGPQHLTDVDLKNPIANKHHFADKIPKKNVSGLVFILRSPHESILSHRFYELPFIQRGTDISESEIKVIKKDVNNYLENISFYESFEGPKEIILYEDLVGQNYERSIQSLDAIFNFDKDKLSDFVENFLKYKIDSIKSPHRNPISANESNNKEFYRNKVMNKNPKSFEIYESILEDLINHEMIKKYYA